MLILLFLISNLDCKTLLLKQDDKAPCPGYLISAQVAEKAFDIVENLYPKLQSKNLLFEQKISLLEEELKVDVNLIKSLKQEIVIYKKDFLELMEFSKQAVLLSDKQQKLQTVIVVVSVGVTIVLMVGAVIAVGYLAQSFTK